jgi:hypothetical protein
MPIVNVTVVDRLFEVFSIHILSSYILKPGFMIALFFSVMSLLKSRKVLTSARIFLLTDAPSAAQNSPGPSSAFASAGGKCQFPDSI